MIAITEAIQKARVHEWTSEEQQVKQKELFAFLTKLFNIEHSPARISLMFSLMVCTHKPEVLWLDEIAEALRNCAEGLDSYILLKQNMLYADRKAISAHDKAFHDTVEASQRMVCYGIGVVAYRLIQLNSSESDDRKNLSKLNILQGGVEVRFIPSLTSETKMQIEGSFKISHDKQLRELSYKNESEVVYEAADSLLMGILDQSKS